MVISGCARATATVTAPVTPRARRQTASQPAGWGHSQPADSSRRAKTGKRKYSKLRTHRRPAGCPAETTTVAMRTFSILISHDSHHTHENCKSKGKGKGRGKVARGKGTNVNGLRDWGAPGAGARKGENQDRIPAEGRRLSFSCESSFAFSPHPQRWSFDKAGWMSGFLFFPT